MLHTITTIIDAATTSHYQLLPLLTAELQLIYYSLQHSYKRLRLTYSDGCRIRVNLQRRSSIAAVHCRRPCVSRGRCASVEQSARFRHGVNVAAHVQATPEDCTVREKLLNTGRFRRLEHLPSHVILFAFNFVRCPCSRSDTMPP